MEKNNYNDGALLPVMLDSQKVVQPEEQQNPFILGNTQEISLERLQDEYLVPVFSRDNVETISHTETVSTVLDAVQTFFHGQEISTPIVRCSHEMKLRTNYGKGKLVENLRPEDCGSYMQRMMFMVEIPSITQMVNGNILTLQVVGVHSYTETNLLGNSSQRQIFRVGVGFLNTICTNLLLKTDGCNLTIKVTNTADLFKYCMDLFQRYDYKQHLQEMEALGKTMIDVPTLAQFLGRARMAAALPSSMKAELNLPEFILPESQINSLVRDYYTDENFGGFGKEISAWQLYMLCTNYKNNYIDVSMERSINAFDMARGIAAAINRTDDSWSWFIK